MSSIKQAIQQKIVSPATHTRGSISTLATVLQSDEKNNLCSINYVDKNGIQRNRDNVPVRIYGGSTDWFPGKDDLVLVEDCGNYIYIVGQFDGNYAADIRAKKRLKQDIHADTNTSTVGGYVF